MKWMGGWSPEQWYGAPLHLTNAIIQCVKDENEELERMRSK